MGLRGRWVVALLGPSAACSLDWGSLEPDGGGPADAANDGVRFPDIGTRDVWTSNDDGGSDADDDTTPGDPDSGDLDAGADATVDAWVSDAGVDAWVFDAGIDAGVDAGADADAGCGYVFSGTLATYDFTGQPGNEASVSVSSTASGLSAGDVSRSAALTATLGKDSINSSGWSTSSLDTTRYDTFTLTPPSQCTLSITSVDIDTLASGTGPANAAMATSDDGFKSTSTFSPSSVVSVSLSVSKSTKAVEIRVYGYNAGTTLGTLRIENSMTVSGSLN